MTQAHHPSSVLPKAKQAGTGFVNSRAFELLARAGFVARGLVYGIIGVLALDLAIGHGGKITNQQGALHTVERQPFGHFLLTLVAIGLGGYSLWRLTRAIVGHGPEGADKGIERLGALGSGIVYGVLCAVAIELLTGSSGSTGGSGKTAGGVLSWPAGRELVGAAGAVMIGVAIYQLIRGIRLKFLDDSKTEQMSPAVKRWFTPLGVVGHVARAVVYALVGVFLLKAAIDYNPNEAVGLDGALAKIYHQSSGPWLLGLVAAGLIAFALFSITEARYRRV
jgi:hypothetical protein